MPSHPISHVASQGHSLLWEFFLLLLLLKQMPASQKINVEIRKGCTPFPWSSSIGWLQGLPGSLYVLSEILLNQIAWLQSDFGIYHGAPALRCTTWLYTIFLSWFYNRDLSTPLSLLFFFKKKEYWKMLIEKALRIWQKKKKNRMVKNLNVLLRKKHHCHHPTSYIFYMHMIAKKKVEII